MRNDEYRVSSNDERQRNRAHLSNEWLAPSLRVAAQIGPYFVAGLDFGTTKAVRPTPRLARFSLATPLAPIVLTGPNTRLAVELMKNGEFGNIKFDPHFERGHIIPTSASDRPG